MFHSFKMFSISSNSSTSVSTAEWLSVHVSSDGRQTPAAHEHCDIARHTQRLMNMNMKLVKIHINLNANTEEK